jgi:hypothetical protein
MHLSNLGHVYSPENGDLIGQNYLTVSAAKGEDRKTQDIVSKMFEILILGWR